MLGTRRFHALAGLILLIAAGWRITLAAAMPCISRDGSLYCWFARDLGRAGVEILRDPRYQQHPLFPLTILAAQRVLLALGLDDTPMTWQRAGQLAALVSGLAVVIALGVLAGRISRWLRETEPPAQAAEPSGPSDRPPLRPRLAALVAMALAAILPLNTRLSADVMSDQLHAALYLFGVACIMTLPSWSGVIGVGVLGGLAFLTRPEGAVVALAGGMALLLAKPRLPVARIVTRGLGLVAAFVAIAAPYWLASGTLTPKLRKETVEQFANVSAAAPAGRPLSHGRGSDQHVLLLPAPQSRGSDGDAHRIYAALDRLDQNWFEALPYTLYHTFRAGRVVIPALAIGPLVVFARRWREPTLFGAYACMLIHFSLTNLLLARYGYLAPRHTLIVVLLMIPFAALMILHLCGRSRDREGAIHAGRRNHRNLIIASSVALITLGVLGFYAARVPNGADAPVRATAAWLVRHDPRRQEKVLLGGSSERRIAFYADTRWRPWPENEPDPEQRCLQLRDRLLDLRPDYFAITTEPQDRPGSNRALLQQLQRDARVGPRLHEVHAEPRNGDGDVHLFAVTRP
jgi:hypothetical protein